MESELVVIGSFLWPLLILLLVVLFLRLSLFAVIRVFSLLTCPLFRQELSKHLLKFLIVFGSFLKNLCLTVNLSELKLTLVHFNVTQRQLSVLELIFVLLNWLGVEFTNHDTVLVMLLVEVKDGWECCWLNIEILEDLSMTSCINPSVMDGAGVLSGSFIHLLE